MNCSEYSVILEKLLEKPEERAEKRAIKEAEESGDPVRPVLEKLDNAADQVGA